MAKKAGTGVGIDPRVQCTLVGIAVLALVACATATAPAPDGEAAGQRFVASSLSSDRQPPQAMLPPAVAPQPPTSAVPAVSPVSAVSAVSAVPADEHRAFGTRHAYFAPAVWSQLPGWQEDDLADAWRAFGQSCAVLGRKPAWERLCGRAAHDMQGKAGIRDFFEREFTLYEIRNSDRTPDGMITGYYEPLLHGSRLRQGIYAYPVYGIPSDMLTLDIRSWPKSLRGLPISARVEGRQVIPVPGVGPPEAPYVVDIGGMTPDDRDKKLRLRIQGDRLVPYFTRAEIERRRLPSAPVLAWVDSPLALYSMQIQGSGKVRLPDGQVLRLAYAEQNGHPFMPPARQAVKGGMTTRGLDLELSGADASQHDAAAPAPTRSLAGRGAAASSSPARSSSEVDRMIEQLAGGPSTQARRPGTNSPGSPAVAYPAVVPERPKASTAPIQASARMLAAISADPSYVFFREIPDGPGGPIGALGVPLTAGRSVAVDPRTTPLGFPVFLTAGPVTSPTSVKRLMMAQDTGGAIRGAVRADYFWGFGADAYARAATMKQNGRMWLLMPRGLSVAARDQPKTRSATGGPALSDCVVADDVSCVEDR